MTITCWGFIICLGQCMHRINSEYVLLLWGWFQWKSFVYNSLKPASSDCFPLLNVSDDAGFSIKVITHFIRIYYSKEHRILKDIVFSSLECRLLRTTSITIYNKKMSSRNVEAFNLIFPLCAQPLGNEKRKEKIKRPKIKRKKNVQIEIYTAFSHYLHFIQNQSFSLCGIIQKIRDFNSVLFIFLCNGINYVQNISDYFLWNHSFMLNSNLVFRSFHCVQFRCLLFVFLQYEWKIKYCIVYAPIQLLIKPWNFNVKVKVWSHTTPFDPI